MLRTVANFIVLGTVAVGGLVAAGCASNLPDPYALTGRDDPREAAKRYEWVHRYGDSKGIYRMGNPAAAAVPSERP